MLDQMPLLSFSLGQTLNLLHHHHPHLYHANFQLSTTTMNLDKLILVLCVMYVNLQAKLCTKNQ